MKSQDAVFLYSFLQPYYFHSSFIHIVIFIYRTITKQGTETMLQGIQAAQPVVQGGGIQPGGDGQIWLACDVVQQPKCWGVSVGTAYCVNSASVEERMGWGKSCQNGF